MQQKPPTMTPNRWQQIMRLFNEALDLPEPERADFLAESCGEDEKLRQEVENLLQADAQAEASQALSGPFEAGESLHELSDLPTDERIGPYRLVRLLGRGGMGNVYLAERDDAFQKQVALKLIRRGLDTNDLVVRFHYERQILASLEHPNIARLLDGGMTDDGRPYFVMEYVEGESIVDYCDRRRLTTKQRLALFRSVCRAVGYAHRMLVVHRDLKPSNILVTEVEEAGEVVPWVKLLDFGVARLLDEEAYDQTTPHTQTGRRLMTPAYAAPEQVRGDAVSTATDVYQLGVLLYELLTGRRPHRLEERQWRAVEQAILEEEPLRPSTAVYEKETVTRGEETMVITPEMVSQARATTPDTLARGLAGDLDNIVLKALKKEPERRYVSVEALEEDLKRHLTGLPVAARPDTLGYRASRFVRRHRLGVLAAIVVLLAVLGGAGVALWQASVAATERDRAQTALVQAEGALDFLENTILTGDPSQGDYDAPLSTVLDSAAARVDDEAPPEVAATIHHSLARVYLGRGLPQQAEHHAQSALDLSDPEVEAVRYGAALALLAQALADGGDREGALPVYERALNHLRSTDEARHELAGALITYGVTLFELDRPEEAEAAYYEALDHFRALGLPESIATLNDLAALQGQRGRYKESAATLSQLITELRHRDDPEAAYGLAFALSNQASAFSNLGQIDSALVLRRAAWAQYAEVMGDDHPETIIAHVSLAFDLHKAEQLAEAEREAEAALATAESALGGDHFYTSYAQNVAGIVLCDAGSPERGAVLFQASLVTRRQQLPDGHWALANGESLLGGCLTQLERYDEAGPLLQGGYEALQQDFGPDHARTQDARERLRNFYEATGQTEAAADLK